MSAGPDARIRTLDREGDLPTFLELNFETFYASIPEAERPTEVEFREQHAQIVQRFKPTDINRSRVTVAYNGQEAYMGHCWFIIQNDFFTNAPLPWILDITVKPQWRSQGIGKLLLDDAVYFARQLGYHTLGLQVMGHNEAAHRFYERYGFGIHSRSMTLRF